MKLIEPTDRGLYCSPGDFYLDPWRPVERAVVTHAHSDHARWGCGSYLASTEGREVLRCRVGKDSKIESLDYGVSTNINGVTLSLHPAGHILGSSQIRLEYKGEVWVFSGDYKTTPDGTCTPFEPVRCHTFITESTFGMPIYRWRPQSEVMEAINSWWRQNQERNRVSVILAYSLGKAQRIIAGVDPSIGPIFVHGAVHNFIPIYRDSGINLPYLEKALLENAPAAKGRGLIIAPPSAAGTPWLKKFGPASLGFASGWMAIRGARRRQSLDRGFILSDHADWPGLMQAIEATGASTIAVTHGYIDTLVRYLTETTDLNAYGIATRYTGEPLNPETEETNGPVPTDLPAVDEGD